MSLAQTDSREDLQEAPHEQQTRSEVRSSEAEDEVAERQSVDAFNSIEDGQPGAPGSWELQFDLGWQTTSHQHDPATLYSEIKYTPDGNDFLRNMKLELAVPIEMGLGGVDGNGDVSFGWKQRWVKEEGCMPTLSTLAEVRLPTGFHSSGVDGSLTGVVAKDAGPGTLFWNGWIETVNGNNVEEARHFQWGMSAGYKWRITEEFAMIGDYVHQCSEEEGHANVNALELSGMYKVNEHFTIGPGILVGLDDNEETPNFGAGVRFQLSL